MRTAVDRLKTSERAKYWDCFKRDRTEEVSFWARLAKLYGKRILAPMAATGEVAAGLAKQGFEVTALEVCPEMLEICQVRAAGLPNLEVVRADVTELCFKDRQFDFVFLTACDYQILCDPEDRMIALQSLHCVMRPGGGLAFEMMPLKPEPQAKPPHEFEPWRPPCNGAQLKMTSWSEYESHSRIHRIHRRLKIEEGDLKKEIAYEVPLQLLSRVEIHALLCQHGFHKVIEYGDYDFSIYLMDSPRWIVHAERRPGC